MKKLRIVFDIDDTISVHKDRDYENAKPYLKVIEKINKLHDMGIEIVLYTARGMVSCNGDIDLIKERNEHVLVDWLKRNNVKYDELIFGKPIADMYIDDKCMNVNEFLNQDFCELKGGSNKEIFRLGNIVKKELDPLRVQRVKDWIGYVKSNDICNTPNLISSLYNYIYIEFIDGKNAIDIEDVHELSDIVNELVITINKFKTKTLKDFNLNKHIESLKKNKGILNELDLMIDKCIYLMKSHEDIIKSNASFCHGDFTLSNIVVNKENEIYLIDPEMDVEASTYLLDYAKLLVSLLGYEQEFNLTKNKMNLKPIRDFLEDILKHNEIYDVAIIFTYMHFLRMARYKEKSELNILLKLLRKLEEENEELFKIS